MTAADLTPAFFVFEVFSRPCSRARRRRRAVDATRPTSSLTPAPTTRKKVPRRARTVRLLVGHERLEVVDRAIHEDARQVLARDGRHEGVGARREDALVVGDQLVAAGHRLFVHI